jgi:putative two-component system response regulator
MKKPNILIVDDSPSVRFLIRKLLKPMNVEIEEAADGMEGLDRVKKRSFDLVISDVDMPRMNGLEFCRSFKSIETCRAIPVIMVSAFDSERDIRRGFEAGVEFYLSKSDVKTDLLQTVQRILSKATFRQKRVVLVVDDSASIRHIVKEGLQNAGFQVITAGNGRTALAVMKKRRPDLILSDIDMPEMNGFELCRTVKSDNDLSSIPFVVMSTNKERGHMKGMIENGATSYITKPFNPDHLVILIEKYLSDHVALLLKDRERLERERNLMLGGITSLISALEARDAYTRGHSEAVADILSEMVALTGANPNEIESAHIGGRLHDIGKIGVPDSILLKPGRLSIEEMDEIKRHPVTGKNILESIPSLSEIIPIVHFHHERWDGKGYPLGLKENEIPLWARFTAVADTYHALTSDRPYRKGISEERALEIIRAESGTQFCPESADLFFKWYHERTGITAEYGTFG